MINKDKVKEKAMKYIMKELEKNGYIVDSNNPIKSNIQLMITISMTNFYPQSIVCEDDTFVSSIAEIYKDILAAMHERYFEYEDIVDDSVIRYFTLLSYDNTEDFKTRIGLG